jgi:hypothetical protein
LVVGIELAGSAVIKATEAGFCNIQVH